MHSITCRVFLLFGAFTLVACSEDPQVDDEGSLPPEAGAGTTLDESVFTVTASSAATRIVDASTPTATIDASAGGGDTSDRVEAGLPSANTTQSDASALPEAGADGCATANDAGSCLFTGSNTTSEQTSEEWQPIPVVVDPNNLLENGSFEDGVGGWEPLGSSTVEVSATVSRSGEKSLSSVARTQSWEGLGIEALPLLQSGKQYVASGWVRSGDEVEQPFHLLRKAICASEAGVDETEGASVYAQLGIGYTGAAWSQIVSAPFTIPDCELTTFMIYFEGPAPGHGFYLDDVAIVEVN